jgi:hypothetical protein
VFSPVFIKRKITKCYKDDTWDSQVILGLPAVFQRYKRTARKHEGERDPPTANPN